MSLLNRASPRMALWLQPEVLALLGEHRTEVLPCTKVTDIRGNNVLGNQKLSQNLS